MIMFFIHVVGPCVMGAYVYAPRHSNSLYGQTYIWSVYDTRRAKHPHSPICRYEQRPQAPVSTRYMESCLTRPDLHIRQRLHLQYRHLCCHLNHHEHAAPLRARPLPHLIRHRDPRHLHRKFCTIQQFQLDWTQGFLWDLTQIFPNRFDPSFSTRLDSCFLIIFD